MCESDLLRKLFETVVARCIKERIVGGEAFAVDASMIVADAHRRRGVAKVDDARSDLQSGGRGVLSVLDDAAFGGATPVEPKSISPTDPAARSRSDFAFDPEGNRYVCPGVKELRKYIACSRSHATG